MWVHIWHRILVEVTGQLARIGSPSTVDFGTKRGHQAFTDHPAKPREMQSDHL